MRTHRDTHRQAHTGIHWGYPKQVLPQTSAMPEYASMNTIASADTSASECQWVWVSVTDEVSVSTSTMAILNGLPNLLAAYRLG